MIEFGIVRLIFLENIVYGSQQHSGNGDDGLLVSPAFLQREIATAHFGELLSTDSIKSALNKQRLDVDSSSADPNGLFLFGALVVLRRKPSPGAEMLRGGEHGHIHADFQNDTDCGKGLDTRRSCNEVDLREVFFSGSQDQRL